MEGFALAFIATFVAMDAPGVVPVFLGLSADLDRKTRRKVVLQASLTAVAVGIGFIFLGASLFGVLGIAFADFRVAGGLLLLLFSIQDLTMDAGKAQRRGESIGIVPIGIPLIAGPAVLTTLLLSKDLYGLPETLAAFGLNVFIAWASLHWSGVLKRVLGEPTMKAIGKVASLLLAAYGVMMIRVGIEAMVAGPT
jgi:multiple antibiotic resistance protein